MWVYECKTLHEHSAFSMSDSRWRREKEKKKLSNKPWNFKINLHMCSRSSIMYVATSNTNSIFCIVYWLTHANLKASLSGVTVNCFTRVHRIRFQVYIRIGNAIVSIAQRIADLTLMNILNSFKRIQHIFVVNHH